ncbi:Tyrosine-protein phosphatase non-receptor type 23 [Parelaphostrongylus tenuis]|uniref:Tyrosine-protein phosphatase non-receptor type 23 n=1 Tax=Parelaphostrongylus tenuis TaxID=148309 RepID=A0AAD5QHD2_PARTN|nr:Tyrosine-protein phosphatase non-receptor type 23 [Parelaphostrongylus tenuis]
MDIAHSATYDDIGFELACVMYNIGAVHANIAVNESREDENSIKNAFMHFQYAAWPLQHLRDKLNASKYASIDFDKELLTFFINVLLGQAQECLLEKSLIDHRSNIVVTKLAIHLRDRYHECLRHLEDSNLCDYVSSKRFKLWTRTCAIKSEMYGCIAMIHMGCQADEDKKMGTRYGYYKLADDHLSSIMKLAEKEDRESMKASISFLSDVVVTKLNNAKKENEFIFHDRVPSSQELCEKLEGLCKVRPLSFDPLDISVGGEDLFGALLPPGVIKAVSEYEEEKDRLKREVLERVSKKDDELNAFLVSLRIDEIDLEVDSTAPNLPDMLLERNAALTAQPDAIPKLLENLQKVSELAREADAKLGQLTGRMNDVDLPQITSDEGYKAVKKELDRLTEHHQKARSNNMELHKAIAAHTTNLHLLSLPIYELRNKLSGPAINAGSTPEGAALRRLLEKTREMQTQRNSLVQRFTEEINKDNIAKKLLSERDSDHKETYAVELKKHETTKKYLDANLDAQEKILSALTEANADFSEFRKKIKAMLNTRSEHIMTLVTAYDVYCDVCSKVEDGRNFYLKLLDRLGKLAVAVEGIETAFGAEKHRREEEKRSFEEKLAELKRANEARKALADFAIGTLPNATLPGGQSVARADRPRLGDYMKFYRNKMAAGTEPPGTSTLTAIPSTRHPSSPTVTAPSTGYAIPAVQPQGLHSGGAVFKAHLPAHLFDVSGRASLAHHWPPHAHQPDGTPHSGEALPQNLPSHLNPAFQQPIHPQPNHTNMLPVISQSSSTVVGSTSYTPQHYNQRVVVDSLSTPSVVTPIASLNASLGTTCHQQQDASQILTSHAAHPPFSTVQHQFVGTPSAAPQCSPEYYHGQFLGSCPTIPGAPVSLNQNAVLPSHISEHHSQQVLSTSCLPQQQAQLPSDQLTLSRNGTAGMVANIVQPERLGMHTITGLQVIQHSPVTFPQGNESVNQGSNGMPQAQPMSKTMFEKQTLHHGISPSPQMSHLIQQSAQFPPIPPSSISPWHSKVVPNVMQSPWHAGVSVNTLVSGTLPVPPVQLQQIQQNQILQDHPQSFQRSDKNVPNVVQDNAQSFQAVHKNVPNMDLLDGLADNSNLPPAMVPVPKSLESQDLLQTCEPSSSSSSETLTLSAIHRFT